ncbi:hypothetical protein GCM10011504_47590 [Siccirubricoccus deserti]|uniref:DUF669 domain-containing protein n=1 Tax=Siccirubricoccus deserti TaxID=2013562 RepID=A0A9X0UJK0_9PROT|nr:DUF669 domain-containing protein [Siccirubricoccus deserti]MBC4018190.1 DUF669 domain-containing protein [Siccirubricoccus deserti]GGC63861.1 hypothetical protein GCM10011504_47590 [Siccirubricoccus deserti]
MAQLNQHFDASAVEPAAPFELLPPGKYAVQIVQSEMRPTKAGTGQMLWLEMDVVEGPHQGRKIWDQLNLVNPNQQTVEIAQRTLSAICHAVGQLQVSDSEQLHLRPMLITLAVEPDKRDEHLPPEERRKQNRVKGYAPLGNAPGPRTAPAAAAVPRASAPPPRPTATASAATPPWRRAG